eukprot:Gb_05872 [translate_table: standard]
MGALAKYSKGWIWWLLSVGIAALVATAAVLTIIHSRKHSHGHQHPLPVPGPPGAISQKYAGALKVALGFFDVQKSGKLPADNPIPWRGNSALSDGNDVGVDLSGGLYDAGDHIKFGLPMAFTCTVLSWSVLEYGDQMNAAQQLGAAQKAIRWITDYLIKAHPSSNELYIQVGNATADHSCWERPETMREPRPSLKVDSSNPGSDVAAETAAAMASASLVFRKTDSAYSDKLVSHAEDLFHFADTYRGSYSRSIPSIQAFYNSTGYEDELLWAAAWLYHATHKESYLDYVSVKNGQSFAQWGAAPTWFSWDSKHAGVQVLLARTHLLGAKTMSAQVSNDLEDYKSTADAIMCAFLPDSPTATTNRTEGGLIWVGQWNAVQHAVNSAFLAVIYSDYMLTSRVATLDCSDKSFSPLDLRNFASSQVDYILGKNPMSISYLVGFGENYPKQVHHRGASIPLESTSAYDCKSGFTWFNSKSPNPNVATGGLVGGPFQNDSFIDARSNPMQNEPSTYNSAAMVGLLSGLVTTSSVEQSFS